MCCGTRTCRYGVSGIPCWPPPSHLVDVFCGRRADGAVSVAGGGVLGLALISNYAWGISRHGCSVSATRPVAVGLEGAVPPVRALDVVRDGPDQCGYPCLRAVPVSGYRQYHPAALLAGAVGGVGFGMLFRVGASSGGTDVIVMVARKRWGVDIGSMSFISTWLSSSRPLWSWISKDPHGRLCCTWSTVTIDRY